MKDLLGPSDENRQTFHNLLFVNNESETESSKHELLSDFEVKKVDYLIPYI